MWLRALPIFVMLFSPLAFAKYKVCTATINSSEEQEVFKSKLPKDQFDFIELTDYSSDKKTHQNDWFKNACEQGVQCDVLVISGHFGGEFFGKSEFKLGLTDLNHYSCYNRCDGIMTHPKEVYLFGCNTLATKAKDSRDQPTYRDVLVADGVDRTEAERRAAARYGPFGSSFKDQIERSFENVPVIYGFDSIGPAGMHVKPTLAKYLDATGDFKKHLDSLPATVPPNPIWFNTMRMYNSAQGKGLQRSNPVYAIKENSCVFTDDTKPVSERLQLVEKLLTQDPYVYLPTISSFVNAKGVGLLNSAAWTDREAAQKMIDQLSRRSDLKNMVEEISAKSQDSPAIEVDLIATARNLNWITQEEYDRRLSGLLRPLMQKPSVPNADLLCSLVDENNQLIQFLSPDDMRGYTFSKPEEFTLFGCARLQDKEITHRAALAAVALRKPSTQLLMAVASAFMNSQGDEELMAQFFRSLVGYKGPYATELRDGLPYILMQKVSGAEQVELVRKKLADPAVQLSMVTYGLDLNPRVEPLAAIAVLDFMVRARADQLANVFINTGNLFGGVQSQNWIAQNFDRLPESLREQVISAAGVGRPIRSKAFRLKLLALLRAELDRDGLWYMGSYHGLAQSGLEPDEIAQLNEMMRVALGKTNISYVQYIRHVLYSQARRGRLPLTDDLRLGAKSYLNCKATLGGGLQCGTQTYPSAH